MKVYFTLNINVYTVLLYIFENSNLDISLTLISIYTSQVFFICCVDQLLFFLLCFFSSTNTFQFDV